MRPTVSHRRAACAGLVAVPLLFAAPQAGAVWVQCQASGTGERGPVGFYAAIVDVGPAPPQKLADIQRYLIAYASKYDPKLTGLTAQCATSLFQEQLASSFGRVLTTDSRRLGWDHVVVVQPRDWLPAKMIVNEAEAP
jgi:hypothetical protein